jgi:elongation factor G
VELERIRNLGIAAHIDAGKTTVTERLLVQGGVERRFGRVDEGSATMDWLAAERERGITISAACTRIPWKGYALNLIDTPGHVDFTLEVERAMRVLDGGVLVLDAQAGVQAQSETVWRQMRRHGVRALAFLNKCDRPDAAPEACLAALRERLGVRPLLVQHALLEGGRLLGVVDLVTRAFEAAPGHPDTMPEAMRDEVEVLRAELCDELLDLDETLLERALEQEAAGAEPATDPGLTPTDLSAALRRQVLAGTALPTLCGSALEGVGTRGLLDAVVAWLPSPAERPGEEAASSAGGPPVLLVFKAQRLGRERVDFARLVQGTLTPEAELINARTGRSQRVERILRVHADATEELEEALAGDLVALTGLEDAGTGDTLHAAGAERRLQPPELPPAVLSQRLEPERDEDRAALGEALAELVREDPSLRLRPDLAAGQWTLEGMGELHLEVARQRLIEDRGLLVRVTAPEVALVEVPQREGEATGRIRREQVDGVRFGAARVRVAPCVGAGVSWQWDPGCRIPGAFRAEVEAALRAASQAGPLAGAPLEGAAITVGGGESIPGEDSEVAFCQAAVLALRDAALAAGVRIEEPLVAYEVVAPEEFASAVAGDLAGRGAVVELVRSEGALRVMTGKVPLARMMGYATGLRSVSQGRATHSLRPEGRAPMGAADLARLGLGDA